MRGVALLTALKESAGLLPHLSLVIGQPPMVLLRPLATEPDRIDSSDVQRLTDWRNRYARAFLSEFTSTPVRTSRWLAGSVRSNNSKILFMVDDTSGRTVGYMGLDYIDWAAGYGEADAVVRGEPTPKGFMRTALLNLLSWARRSLELRELGVRVLSDNSAVRFYEQLGFRPIRSVPLRRELTDDGCKWLEDESNKAATRYLTHMRLATPMD